MLLHPVPSYTFTQSLEFEGMSIIGLAQPQQIIPELAYVRGESQTPRGLDLCSMVGGCISISSALASGNECLLGSDLERHQDYVRASPLAETAHPRTKAGEAEGLARAYTG